VPLVELYRPEVLLLDLAMPTMNGFDVAMELQKNPDLRPKLLIAITGYGDQAAREMTTQAGFDFHLVKPVKLAKLLTLLATVFPTVKADVHRPLIDRPGQ
jgi:CheY-like chemotaxis protein